jgi:hypothetical protein
MQLVQVPDQISRRCRAMCEDGRVFAYYEFRTGSGRTAQSLFKGWEDLTVADCEQLAEQYVRLARQAITRFCFNGGSKHSAKTAAEYMYRAKLCRWRYQELTGQEPNECDQVFPILTPDEAKAISETMSAG